MDWLKQIPDDELIYVASAVVSDLAGAVKEYRAAKLHLASDRENKVAQVRFEETHRYFIDRRDRYDAMSQALRERGLKE